MTYLIIDPDDLTQDQEVVYDLDNKTIQLVKTGNLGDEGVTLQCLYSFCKNRWSVDSTLIKFGFPFDIVHEEKFELARGWNFKDDTTKQLVRIGGWALKDAAGNTQEEYACVITLGVIGDTDQVYYQQTAGGASTNIVLTGTVNQAVKTYGDVTHGNFDYRSYFKIFVREYAKTYATAQLSDIGVTTMTYQAYRFPLTNASDLKVVDDDNTVDTTVPYTNMSITWYASGQERMGLVGGSGYFHVIINGASGTAEEIYTYAQRQLRKDTDIDAGADSKIGKVTPEMLYFVGDTLYTRFWNDAVGTFIDNYQAVDETRLKFKDDADALRNFPYAAVLTLNFGEWLQADTNAKYWVFFSESIDPEGYDYGTVNAIIIEDKNNNPMSGNVSSQTAVQLTYDFDTNQQRGNSTNPPEEEIPITAVAIGLSTAQFVMAAGTVTRSLSNVVSLVAALERGYST